MEEQYVERPQVCPKCGGKVVEIIYGEPTEELFYAAERGEVMLGDCCIQIDKEGNIISPNWGCIDCQETF